MRRFLAEEAEAQTRILVALRGRLERGMTKADPAASDPPSREWVRACRLYIDGWRSLATLELEGAKLRLLAQRTNAQRPLTDEEYAAQLEQLGRDAIRTLAEEDIRAELERRRTSLPAPQE